LKGSNLLKWFFPHLNKLDQVVDPEKAEKKFKEEPVELEKGDLKAMLIAGFLVFGPFILIVAGIMIAAILLLR